jgi:hypothetical protein
MFSDVANPSFVVPAKTGIRRLAFASRRAHRKARTLDARLRGHGGKSEHTPATV